MIDHTDKQILEALSKNSRMTMKELGEKVHLTGPAAASRVTKMLDNGVITGCSIEVNQVKMGYPLHAFINIYTKSTHHQPYLSFIKKHGQYIVNNYKISGESCYLLESRFPSNEALDEFLSALNDYANYKLSIVISRQ